MGIFTVFRIMVMEYCFDTLLRHSPEEIQSRKRLLHILRRLTAYYEGGQWLRDYTLDEQGQLPRWLKRGVLSQDGLYDLLFRLEHHEEIP